MLRTNGEYQKKEKRILVEITYKFVLFQMDKKIILIQDEEHNQHLEDIN